MTNALLVLLISLISAIAGIGYKKFNELMADVKALLRASDKHTDHIDLLRKDLDELTDRVEDLEKRAYKS